MAVNQRPDSVSSQDGEREYLHLEEMQGEELQLKRQAFIHLSFTCNPVHLAHPGQNRHVEAADPKTHRQHRQLSCCLLHKMHPSET